MEFLSKKDVEKIVDGNYFALIDHPTETGGTSFTVELNKDWLNPPTERSYKIVTDAPIDLAEKISAIITVDKEVDRDTYLKAWRGVYLSVNEAPYVCVSTEAFATKTLRKGNNVKLHLQKL